MTGYQALLSALRASVDAVPGRVLRLKVTREQYVMLMTRYGALMRPTFRGIPLVVQ